MNSQLVGRGVCGHTRIVVWATDWDERGVIMFRSISFVQSVPGQHDLVLVH